MKIATLLLFFTFVSATFAATPKPQRKPNSVRQVILTCKPGTTGNAASGNLILYLDETEGKQQTLLVSTSNTSAKTGAIEAITVIPQEGYSSADAWSGSPRLLKSISLKALGGILTIPTEYNSVQAAYVSIFQNKDYNCSLNGSFSEAMNEIKATLPQ